MSLWARLAVTVGLAVTLCFCGFGLIIAQEQERAAAAEIGALNRAIAQNIDAAVADDLLERRLDNIEALLLRLARIGSVSALSVADANGKIVSRVTRETGTVPRADFTRHPQRAPLASAEVYQDRLSYRYLAPIMRASQIGSVEVVSSLAGLAQVRRSMYVDTARTTLIALALCIVTLGLALRGTLGSLREAVRFAGQLGTHRGQQLPLHGTVREVQELTDELNRASSALAAQHQALLASELRKSVIMDVALDCFITIDEQGLIIDFNRAAELTFGYAAHEVRGLPMDQVIIPPSLRQAHRAGMARHQATGQSKVMRQRIELTAMRRNGELFPVELAIIPFEIAGRHYYSGYLRDITQRKQMEAATEAVTARLRCALRELEYQKFALDEHSIVSITNADGVITYVNQKLCAVSGYDSAALLGAQHRLVKSGLHEDGVYADLWRTIRAGRVWHGQLANRARNGALYWVATSIVPWLDEHGAPFQYVSIGTDITPQKMVEHALAEARARELDIGIAIQKSLLWGSVPRGLSGAAIACHSEASQGVDGDFFAINRYGAQCFELLVGDVMGKGVPAALIGAAVKNAYSQSLLECALDSGRSALATPAEIVNAMHAALTPHLIELNAFATLALYRFDLERGTLTLVNAGHTPALVLRAQGGAVESILGHNLPIGVLSGERYVQSEVAFHAGDALLAYSDGVTETRDQHGCEFGETRLSDLLQQSHGAGLPPTLILQAQRLVLRNFGAMGAMGAMGALSDDQTSILIQSHDPALPPHPVLDLPWCLEQLGPLRAHIAHAARNCAESVRDALVLASFEAATNIIRHAPRPSADSCLSCMIDDDGVALTVRLLHPGLPFEQPCREPDFSGASEGGFGLFIIEQCVDRVRYTSPMAGLCCVELTVWLDRHQCSQGRLLCKSLN